MNRWLWVVCLLVCTPFVSKAALERDSVPARKDMTHYVFKDTLGVERTFSDLKGNYILVEIWSMSCRPCLHQMTFFKELEQAYKDKPIRFVSICVENNFPLWKKFLHQRGFSGLQWITPILSPFLKENGFMAVPRFVLLDKNGRILWKDAKQPSDPALKKELDELLAK